MTPSAFKPLARNVLYPFYVYGSGEILKGISAVCVILSLVNFIN
jgi:hypothetical protein